jgi:hypothetical protein
MKMDELGFQDGLDTLGAEDYSVGVDYGSILQAAGGLATAGVSAAEQAKKEDAAKADDDKNVKAAIAADQNAATAMAKADVSASTKASSAAIDAQAAQMAITAQDQAGAKLSSDGQKKRAQAADDTLAAVVKVSQSKPGDVNQTALVKAWTAVANKAHAGAILGPMGTGGGKGGDSGGSWLTRPVGTSKIPGYGVLLLGAGGLGALWLLAKKFVFKAAVGG